MTYYSDDTVTLHHGNSLEVLRTLASGSVDCCVTSPPFFGLRSYLPEGHPDNALEIGTEKTPAEYVESLRLLFAEVRRVLADDGTCWVNVGDSYYSGKGSPTQPDLKNEARRPPSRVLDMPGQTWSAPKNLLGIPWRVAFALQDDDSGDIYELNADAPDAIRSAVYWETCRTKIPKPLADTAGNTPSDGEQPILSDSQNAWQNGTPPIETRSEATGVSTTNSTASRRSSARSQGTESVTADSGSLRCNTTAAKSPSAHAAESGTSHSSRSTTSTAADASTASNSGHPAIESLNGCEEKATPKDSESSATTATHPADSTARARTKKNERLRKSQIQPDWLPHFRLVKQERWILRNAIVWSKPNAMPESVTDRLSTRYEMVFMFSNSRKYWFDLDPIRDAYSPNTESFIEMKAKWKSNQIGTVGGQPHPGNPGLVSQKSNPLGKNPGDVWNIPTTPYASAHFAVFPRELPRRCIVAGCKPGGTVLDPFHGSGTTGMVATRNGRKYVGIELNQEYLDLSLKTRLSDGVLDFEEGA